MTPVIKKTINQSEYNISFHANDELFLVLTEKSECDKL